jgi:hypothetical protein
MHEGGGCRNGYNMALRRWREGCPLRGTQGGGASRGTGEEGLQLHSCRVLPSPGARSYPGHMQPLHHAPATR